MDQNKGVSDRDATKTVPQLCPQSSWPSPPWSHLKACCMLLLALHVIDVPGHCGHGHNSFLYHLSPSGVRALCPVFAQFLPVIHRRTQVRGKREGKMRTTGGRATCKRRGRPHSPGNHGRLLDPIMPLSTSQAPGATADLQQQMVLQDALNRLQQEALQRQGVTELGLTFLQPQSGWRRQRQLSEQGQGAGGTGRTSGQSVASGGWCSRRQGWEGWASGQGSRGHQVRVGWRVEASTLAHGHGPGPSRDSLCLTSGSSCSTMCRCQNPRSVGTQESASPIFPWPPGSLASPTVP